MSALNAQPNRIPLVDKEGRVTREWQIWLEQLNNRVGGANSPTIKDVSASANEAKQSASDAYDFARFAATLPKDKVMTVDDLIPLVLSLQSSVANLSQDVARLRNLETFTMGRP